MQHKAATHIPNAASLYEIKRQAARDAFIEAINVALRAGYICSAEASQLRAYLDRNLPRTVQQ